MKPRQPIRRHTPLQRAAGDFIRRTRLRPVSPKRQREALGRAAVRAAVFERDGWRCVLSPFPIGDAGSLNVRCGGMLTIHHLRKSAQGGEYSIENGICLCSAHNDAVEDWPDLAYHLGLVVRRRETHEDAATRRKAAGIA